MGKLTTALILVLFIDITLFIFAGSDYSFSALFNLARDPSDLASNNVYKTFLKIATLATVAGIFAGLILQKYEVGVIALIVATLITFTLSIVNLWIFLDASFSEIIGSNVSWLGASILTIPLLIFYLVTMLEMIRPGVDA